MAPASKLSVTLPNLCLTCHVTTYNDTKSKPPTALTPHLLSFHQKGKLYLRGENISLYHIPLARGKPTNNSRITVPAQILSKHNAALSRSRGRHCGPDRGPPQHRPAPMEHLSQAEPTPDELRSTWRYFRPFLLLSPRDLDAGF